MATSEPKIVVEVAWNDNFSEPFPVWTDISDRVSALGTRLGRSNEIGSIEAGAFSVTLDNSDGAFTPGRTDSPFYPNVRPRKQLRVRVDDGTPLSEGPVLTNFVINPNFMGDSLTGFGFPSYRSFSVDPASASHDIDLGYAAYPDPARAGDSISTVVDVLDSDRGYYPCSPGDYVSATVCFDNSSTSGDVVGRLRVWFYDAAGNPLSGGANVTATVPPKGTERAHVENTLAPAGTASVRLFISLDSVGASGYALISRVAGFNHGPSAFDWSYSAYLDTPRSPAYAEWFDGDSTPTDAFAYDWTGIPNQSASIAYAMAEQRNVIARGYVKEWPLTYSGTTGEVTVPCVDATSDFGQRGLTPPLAYEYKSRNPVDLYRLNEGSDATEFVSETRPTKKARVKLGYGTGGNVYKVSGFDPPKIVGGRDTLSPLGLPSETSTGTENQHVYVNSGKTFLLGACLKVPIPVLDCSNTSWSFAFVYSMLNHLKDSAGNPYPAWAFTLHNSNQPYDQGYLRFDIHGYSDGEDVMIRMIDNGGVEWTKRLRYYKTVDSVAADVYGISWDHVNEGLRFMGGDALGIDDGTKFTKTGDTGASSMASIFKNQRYDTLMVMGYSTKDNAEGFADQTMQYLGYWDRALTTDEFKRMRDSLDAFPGQVVNKRLNYILDQIQWPRELRRISASSTQEAQTGWEDGTQALEWLRSTAEDAMGAFYVDPAGRVTFKDRHERTKADVAWTFDHDAGTGVEAGLTFTASEDDIVNVANIDNAFGVKTSVENAASIAEFGRKEQDYSLRLWDDNEAIQYGYHMVNRYGEPQIRVDTVTINPSAQADGLLWDAAKGISFGDKITLAGLPVTAPAASMDFFVESIAHSIVRDGDRLKWTVACDVSPAAVWDGWVLGDPVKSVLGHTTKLEY